MQQFSKRESPYKAKEADYTDLVPIALLIKQFLYSEKFSYGKLTDFLLINFGEFKIVFKNKTFISVKSIPNELEAPFGAMKNVQYYEVSS